ncbi:hypothetical protein GCM10010156_30990 [Planobispora rosea]|uniref:Lipoprotein n=1 Tax=Planobispora rosea TaxID=35762 RepID=A0A8J3WBV9_PLARO|nr:hypothetical protein [Planobispora rosea]GGS70012.1 hypothetical protein GCM10010156_30990 [Planobispora rosea]GIH83207.1 hypothetical protein Pro02_16150 [Planobispora rosea]
MKSLTARRLNRSALVAALAGGVLLAGAVPAATAETTGSATRAAHAKSTLGPFGYGGVKLGMSAKQARATGKITRTDSSGPCSAWALKAHPTGQGLLISRRVGVAVIFAPRGVATPQGIKLGSTAKQLKKAYPRLKESASGYPYASVPGNPKAHYIFLLRNGKIYQLGLALNRQDCAN